MGSILVIRGGAVGDFLLTLPALRLLRRTLPENRLEILGYPAITAVALHAGCAEAVRSIEYGPLSRFFVPGSALPEELSAYFAGFDLVISYLYDPDGFFHDNLKRAGVNTLITGSPKMRPDGGAAARQLAEPLQQLGLYLETEDLETPLAFDAETKASAGAFLSGAGTAGSLVALHPGSGSPSKNWPFERWLAVAEQLAARRPGTRFLLLSGEAEIEESPQWESALRKTGLCAGHAASLPLPVLGAVLGRSALFLGHDTGVGHLAAAAGIPALQLFGPTDPGIWKPPQAAAQTLRHPTGALSRISVAEVVSAALNTLP